MRYGGSACVGKSHGADAPGGANEELHVAYHRANVLFLQLLWNKRQACNKYCLKKGRRIYTILSTVWIDDVGFYVVTTAWNNDLENVH
eukprot:scaffold1221_cov207-Amphora_coffeaeformis.AAC.19